MLCVVVVVVSGGQLQGQGPRGHDERSHHGEAGGHLEEGWSPVDTNSTRHWCFTLAFYLVFSVLSLVFYLTFDSLVEPRNKLSTIQMIFRK